MKWKVFASNSCDEKEWKLFYDAVVAYGERNGADCNIPQSYQCILNKKPVKLGVWLAAQKLKKLKVLLSPDQDALIQVLKLYIIITISINSWSFPQ